MPEILHVIKRNGQVQNMMFDKITSRLHKLCYNLDMNHVDPAAVTLQVVSNLYPGITTVELDNIASRVCASMFCIHRHYVILATRLIISNLHKQTEKSFSQVMLKIRQTQQPCQKFDSFVNHDRDFLFCYFGFKQIEKLFLMRIDDKIIESPQHLLMRVASCIHGDNLDAVVRTYDRLSQHYYTHSTCTMYNTGSRRDDPMLFSSFVLNMEDDSIVGIYNTLGYCARIMCNSGGLGLNISCIRAKGSPIVGTNGESTGIVPMLRVYNSTIKYSDLSPSRRLGAICIYIEPWHADIFEYVGLGRNYGVEELRAKDLSYALWIPDLFMRRVQNDEEWTLFCPRNCPLLLDAFGEEFDRIYEQYEKENKGRRTVKAQQLWYLIVEAQLETGRPMMMYKDSINKKSHVPIYSSSFNGELIVPSSSSEMGACCIGALCLYKFVRIDDNQQFFDFEELVKATRDLVNDLDKLTDKSSCCLDQVSRNKSLRPVGVGVHGLADTFALLNIPFESSEAKRLNRQIFEHVYYGALCESCELASLYGAYEGFDKSFLAKGQFTFDLYNHKPECDDLDWERLRQKIMNVGVRNIALISLSPTKTVAQIVNSQLGVEPFSRLSMEGIVNERLVDELVNSGHWSSQIRERIVEENSLQNIESIPLNTRNVFKTAWEISQRTVLDMAADRAPFIDQSQSLTLHLKNPNYAKISSMHFYAWNKGLKNGMTLLKTKN